MVSTWKKITKSEIERLDFESDACVSVPSQHNLAGSFFFLIELFKNKKYRWFSSKWIQECRNLYVFVYHFHVRYVKTDSFHAVEKNVVLEGESTRDFDSMLLGPLFISNKARQDFHIFTKIFFRWRSAKFRDLFVHKEHIFIIFFLSLWRGSKFRNCVLF